MFIQLYWKFTRDFFDLMKHQNNCFQLDEPWICFFRKCRRLTARLCVAPVFLKHSMSYFFNSLKSGQNLKQKKNRKSQKGFFTDLSVFLEFKFCQIESDDWVKNRRISRFFSIFVFGSLLRPSYKADSAQHYTFC